VFPTKSDFQSALQQEFSLSRHERGEQEREKFKYMMQIEYIPQIFAEQQQSQQSGRKTGNKKVLRVWK
jgi:hypothetical protein